MGLGDIMFYLCTPNMSRDSYRSIYNLLNTAFRNIIYFSLILILSMPNLYAGEYHNPKERTVSNYESLACSQCHTMHGSQGGQSMVYCASPPCPDVTYTKLLRHQSILELCLFCHDGTNSVAIMDGRVPPDISNNNQNYVPSAGDFRHSNVDNEANRHSIGIDVTTTTPPGYDNTKVIWTGTDSVTGRFGSTFNCLYCHAQHGNNNYRNLRYDPGNPVNDNQGTGVNIVYRMTNVVGTGCGTAGTCDVENSDSGGNLPTGLAKYYRANVKFRRTGSDYNKISEWCGKCHSKFFGKSGNSDLGGDASPDPGVGGGDINISTSPWKRHPVGDIDANNTNLHTDYSVGVSASGYLGNNKSIRVADYDANTSKYQPFCLSCHYAHGGGNPNNAIDPTLDHSMLAYIDSSGLVNLCKTATCGTDYDTNTGRMRNVCQQCHNQ